MKINLIPEVKQEQLRIQKLNATATTVATVAFFIVGSIIICLSIYNIVKTTQIASTKRNIEKTKQELEAYKDLEETVVSLENGLNEAKQILSGSPKWSKFLVELEKVTPNDVQFSALTFKGNQVTATLKGKNVSSIDRFLKSFSTYKVNDKNLFDGVVVNGYTTEQGVVTFQAQFALVGGVLW